MSGSRTERLLIDGVYYRMLDELPPLRPIARGIAGGCRAPRCPSRATCTLAARHATARFARVSLRSSGSRRCGPQ